MSRDDLGPFVVDFELGVSERECYAMALLMSKAEAAMRSCPRCGELHANEMQRVNCSMREDQAEEMIPRVEVTR